MHALNVRAEHSDLLLLLETPDPGHHQEGNGVTGSSLLCVRELVLPEDVKRNEVGLQKVCNDPLNCFGDLWCQMHSIILRIVH